MLEKIGIYLQGKKTYIVAILIAIISILEQQHGIVVPEFVYTLLAAAGLAAVRSGIDKLKG